jgi:hypothetical protein
MGWITELFQRVANLEKTERMGGPSTPEESAGSQSVWLRLQNNLRQDAEEFNRAGGECSFESLSESRVRVLNSTAKIAAAITADADAGTIEYSYQAESNNVAVPEKGVLTVREHDGSQQLYSADQQVSLRQAREIILQPVFFPDLPSDQAIA